MIFHFQQHMKLETCQEFSQHVTRMIINKSTRYKTCINCTVIHTKNEKISNSGDRVFKPGEITIIKISNNPQKKT
jgi:hypothetical protein